MVCLFPISGRVVFPSDSEWADVFVVCADSPQEFYVQLTDENHGEAFQKMTAQMNKYFSAASKEGMSSQYNLFTYLCD